MVEFVPLLTELMLDETYDAVLIRALQYYVLQPANKAVRARAAASIAAMCVCGGVSLLACRFSCLFSARSCVCSCKRES
jgi:hypothetical protein